jgi:hypothetical protein
LKVKKKLIDEAGGRIAKLRKSAMSLYGSAVTPGWAAYRAIRGAIDKCTKKCGTFEINTSRRQHCMIKCKTDVLKQAIKDAQKTNPKVVPKLQKQLAKAEKTYFKSIQSFRKRGAEPPLD